MWMGPGAILVQMGIRIGHRVTVRRSIGENETLYQAALLICCIDPFDADWGLVLHDTI